MSAGFSGCLDRNAVYREAHELDRDGVCFFCDETPASARKKELQRSHEADLREAQARGDRAWMRHERRLAERIEDIATEATQ